MKRIFYFLYCLLFLLFASKMPAANWTNYPLVNAPNPSDTFLIGTTTTNQQFSASNLSRWLGTNLTLKSDFSVTNLSIYGSGTNALRINSGVITSSLPAIDISQTWSNSGVTFTGLKVNVTNASSAAASYILDLQTNGSSRFAIDKNGGLWGNGVQRFTWGAAGGGQTYLTDADNEIFMANSGAFRTRGKIVIEYGSGSDTIIGRESSAVFQFGDDAATATAQTLKAHDGSGTDKSGANLNIAAGQGTGAGAGGRIILRTSAAGSSGSSANSYSDVLTATPDGIIGIGITNPTTGKLVISSGVITSSLPAIDISQTWSNSGVAFTGLKVNVTDSNSASGSLLADLQVGGSSKFAFRKDGVFNIGGVFHIGKASQGSIAAFFNQAINNYYDSFSLSHGVVNDFKYASSGNPGAYDLYLNRDAAATLQLGADAATATAQTLKAHDGSGTDKGGADLSIAGGQGTGTGAGGTINFKTAPAGSTGSSLNSYVTRFSIDSTGLITAPEFTTSNLTYQSRSLTASTNMTIDLKGGSMQYVTMTADTVLAVTNVAAGRNISVMFIGPTNSQYNLIMPSSIRLYSGAVTNIVTTNKSAVVSFTSFDGISTNLVTTVAIEP